MKPLDFAVIGNKADTRHPLPFVRFGAKVGRWWALPATGGYEGGYKVGEAMAQIYMQYLRESELGACPNSLAFIMESFQERMSAEGQETYAHRPIPEWPEGLTSIRGQYCGFFNTLNQSLLQFAKLLGAHLEATPRAVWLQQAIDGLTHDNDYWIKKAVAKAKARKKALQAQSRSAKKT
jgi:hypothetical protein